MLLNNMLFRLTADITYTFEFNDEVQYFNALIPAFNSDSIIIDCGGYIGDTLEIFMELGCEFKRYYLFEPDPGNLLKAQKVTADKRVSYIGNAVSDKVGESKLFMANAGSMVADDGEIKISLTTLDSEIDEPVSFIKMDIEGTELSALKGALNIIKKYRPVLAICIYHKPEDFISIFNFIYSIHSDYKFYIRHHVDWCAEYVLYAV